MQIELSKELKTTYREAARHLKGSARRKFMAGIATSMGRGGFSYCARELGWDPKTMRKGRHELETGIDFADGPANPGRKRIEFHLPMLLDHLRQILEQHVEPDNASRTRYRYTRLTVQDVRKELLKRPEYTEKRLPTNPVLRDRVRNLGYRFRTDRKNL